MDREKLDGKVLHYESPSLEMTPIGVEGILATSIYGNMENYGDEDVED